MQSLKELIEGAFFHSWQRTFMVLGGLVLAIALPVTIILTQSQQDIRQRAATVCTDPYVSTPCGSNTTKCCAQGSTCDFVSGSWRCSGGSGGIPTPTPNSITIAPTEPVPTYTQAGGGFPEGSQCKIQNDCLATNGNLQYGSNGKSICQYDFCGNVSGQSKHCCPAGTQYCPSLGKCSDNIECASVVGSCLAPTATPTPKSTTPSPGDGTGSGQGSLSCPVSVSGVTTTCSGTTVTCKWTDSNSGTILNSSLPYNADIYKVDGSTSSTNCRASYGGTTNCTINFAGKTLTQTNAAPGTYNCVVQAVPANNTCTSSSVKISSSCTIQSASPTPTFTSTPTPVTETVGTSPSPSVSPSAGTTSLSISVALPGIGSNTSATGVKLNNNENPKRITREVEVRLESSEGSDVTTLATGNSSPIKGALTFDPASFTYKGFVNLGSIPTANYIVLVRLDNTLYSEAPGFPLITQEQNTTIPNLTLVPGDIDRGTGGDDILNLDDYVLFVACYQGEAICASETSTKADFDDDGDRDIFDLNIMQRGFEKRQGATQR